MREALFIKKNKGRWQEMQANPSQYPDEMAKEFIQLVEDLGFAKTFYPRSSITQYLNTEASKRYIGLYENQKADTKQLFAFFKYRLPLIIRKHHAVLFICFCLFLLFVAIGFFSANKDETFIRQVLGNGYVDMTEQHIAEGHPFKVYGYGNEVLSFFFLFLNNIKVSLIEFAGGILLGIPTIKGLMVNAIMVGAFECFFFRHGMGVSSLLTIMIHGTLELSTFVVAATSGLVMAKSWLFPGTIKRLDALKQGAKEGVIIALANFPMLLMAAFFEGFVTRHTGIPLFLKLVIIGTSLAFVVFYFIVYPIRLQKQLNLSRKD
ncbi:stage II sporulation protein M [Parasediminibacterium sp. JCM 36343]|uniref:stage II sporulation protein M n=1 Tax=Parasediminibacterium sp. JCM 36343 TaxID=3374279 RepID=UPI00397A7053